MILLISYNIKSKIQVLFLQSYLEFSRNLYTFWWHIWHNPPLKVQCVILTASGWNGYCSPNSKYWSELFLLPPPPQTQCSHGLPDWGHTTGMRTFDNGRQRALRCKLMSWFICILVIELFRWTSRLFMSGRICDLWPSSFAGFHGCSML